MRIYTRCLDRPVINRCARGKSIRPTDKSVYRVIKDDAATCIHVQTNHRTLYTFSLLSMSLSLYIVHLSNTFFSHTYSNSQTLIGQQPPRRHAHTHIAVHALAHYIILPMTHTVSHPHFNPQKNKELRITKFPYTRTLASSLSLR